MNEPSPLARMANFLYGAGTPAAGLDLSPPEASRETQRRYPNKPYCLVRQWMLVDLLMACLLYTSPSPRDQRGSRMPSSA